MKAGLLRHRVAVDEAVVVQDTFGEPLTTWTTRAVVWAKVEPLRGREATQLGAQLLADMDTRVTMRWTPTIAAINPRWRLRFGAIVYNVVSVADIEMKHERFELLCSSGKNLG